MFTDQVVKKYYCARIYLTELECLQEKYDIQNGAFAKQFYESLQFVDGADWFEMPYAIRVATGLLEGIKMSP